jgi:hypothetical protein
MVGHLLAILKKKLKRPQKDGIVYVRCDYYNDLKGIPKLTEYNLMSVGMQSNIEQFQQAKIYSDYENKDSYANC